ncbi:MAG: response regulator [Bacteroidota bacterium]
MAPFVRKRILAVDDNMTMVNEIKRWIVIAGYDAECATSGKEALEKIQKESFDLVILDAMMPEMNGFEVARQIRTLYPDAKIPIIMLTGLKVQADVMSAHSAGVNELITKPVEFDELVGKITHYLKSPFR